MLGFVSKLTALAIPSLRSLRFPVGTPKRRMSRRFFFSGNCAVCQPHATMLQNPEIRVDAGLCEQAHRLAIPSLRSLRFPVGRLRNSLFYNEKGCFLLLITFLLRAVTHCNFCQNIVELLYVI